MTKTSIGKLKSVPEALQKSISRTHVEYRRLGKSGLRISNPVLGGLHIGDSSWFPWVLDEDKVSRAAVIHKAIILSLMQGFQQLATNRSHN